MENPKTFWQSTSEELILILAASLNNEAMLHQLLSIASGTTIERQKEISDENKNNIIKTLVEHHNKIV